MRNVAALLLFLCSMAAAGEARLVRYPHWHAGRVVFSYIGDIWTANDDGRNVQRLTAHSARDVYPRWSPDGKWIAFSSERNGNLDIYVVPAAGGQAKQITFHSADDNVLAWGPDSKQILFSSNRGEEFLPKLYTVSAEGGLERSAGADFGVYGTYSPDGTKLALNRKAGPYWRKYYRGAFQSDVTIMDVGARKFTELTDFNGIDSWPMWAQDGHIYFVSDRDGDVSNLWRVSEKGGKAERMSSFKTGDVRWPSISSDGKVITFEHDFGLWKFDVGSRKASPIVVNIAAEIQESMSETRTFASRADDYALAPNSRRVVLSIHGEIFTAPVEEGDLRQITENPARDRNVTYSPDGKQIAFVSDRAGREELYVTGLDGATEPQKITDLDVLKLTYRWSPDSKDIVFTTSDAKLYRVNVASRQVTELAASKFGPITAPDWSPDGKWIAFSLPDYTRNSDIWLVAAAGGEEHRISFDVYNEVLPRFSSDGKKLYFVRVEGTGPQSSANPFPVITNIYSVLLERQERDPDDPEERPESESRTEAASDQPRAPAAAKPQPPGPVNIDFAGLKRRTRQVTRLGGLVFSYEPAGDSRTLAFVTSEPSGTRSIATVYTIQDDGKRQTRITSSAPAGDGPSVNPFGGAVTNLKFSRDNRTLYFMEASGIYSVPVPASALATSSATTPPAGPSTPATRKRVTFNARVKIDKSAEWAQMFGDAWRTMKYRFYDPAMHGRDWDAMRAKYQPLVEHVGDRQELLNLMNEMIGELNASHTGTAPPTQPAAGSSVTRHLGLDLEADAQAGRYKVVSVYEEGPADKDWVKVKKGDYVIAIDGKPLLAGDNYWRLLNNPLNRKITLTLNSQPTGEGSWTTRIEPVPMATFNQLRYERWVRERTELTKKLSNGRVGYLHIQAMNAPSLRKFEKDLRENRDKEALVIDQRWNGGGNIDQELLGILVQRPYQTMQPRGTEGQSRPSQGFFGPKVVLQNWRSASNAEMFPAGFRALGLGKVIGTQTMGAVIGTGSYTLIDGSTIRTPGSGVYLTDNKRTNMENFGVPPDIVVENTPEDNLAGRDRQLELAIQELLKQIGQQTSGAR